MNSDTKICPSHVRIHTFTMPIKTLKSPILRSHYTFICPGVFLTRSARSHIVASETESLSNCFWLIQINSNCSTLFKDCFLQFIWVFGLLSRRSASFETFIWSHDEAKGKVFKCFKNVWVFLCFCKIISMLMWTRWRNPRQIFRRKHRRKLKLTKP